MALIGHNGGLIGARKVPALSGVSGLWTPNEQVVAKRANIWPRTEGLYPYEPILWYDFADEATVTLSSSQVATVADKGSRGWTLSKSATGPTYVTGINGLKCIDWGNTTHSNYLRNTTTTTTTLADVYVVMDGDFGSTFSGYNGLVSGAFDPGVTLYGFGTGMGGNWNQAYVNNSATNTFATPLPAINSPCIVRYKHSTTPPVTSNGFQVGNERSNAGRGWFGLIGEVAVFSTVLNSTDSAAVFAILAAKWGITLV